MNWYQASKFFKSKATKQNTSIYIEFLNIFSDEIIYFSFVTPLQDSLTLTTWLYIV